MIYKNMSEILLKLALNTNQSIPVPIPYRILYKNVTSICICFTRGNSPLNSLGGGVQKKLNNLVWFGLVYCV